MHVGPTLTRDRRDHHCQARFSTETWSRTRGHSKRKIPAWKARIVTSQRHPTAYPIIRIWCLACQRATWGRKIKHLISWLRTCSKMKMWGNLTVYSSLMPVLAMSFSLPTSNLLTSTWTESWTQWARTRRISLSSQAPCHLGVALSLPKSDLNSKCISRLEGARTWGTV